MFVVRLPRNMHTVTHRSTKTQGYYLINFVNSRGETWELCSRLSDTASVGFMLLNPCTDK